jgi:chitobiase/beta-hexosaminidase-like protein
MPFRSLSIQVSLALLASGAFAQSDPSQQAQRAAQQQAMMLSQQLTEEALKEAQLASQSQKQPDYTNLCCFLTESPKLSVKPGKYSEPAHVTITDSTRGAIIYYTTDGWTPTADSKIYTGPITINSTMTLQAIAISPYTGRSFVTIAKYTIDPPNIARLLPAATTAAAAKHATPGKIVLPRGTTVRLVFTSDLTSKTAKVGDKITLTLDQDLVLDGVLAAPKGSQASGFVMQVDKPGLGGLPGQLNFRVNSLNVHGTAVKLRRTAALEGQPKPPNASVLIPVVGPLTLFKRGSDAVIARGTPLDATIDADTTIVSAK